MARRLLLQDWHAQARRAWLMVSLWLAVSAGTLSAQTIIESADFTHPTTAYRHGVLGDAVEYSGLRAQLSDGRAVALRFAEGGRVFEDLQPRLWDVTGDDAPEIVVIETDPPQGAQLAIYTVSNGTLRKLAATPHIGRTHRWLAPIGAADLDQDGAIEIAYVDRPHLAKTLRIWRFTDATLQPVADRRGLTNHRIGEAFISGGLRTCAGTPELITADANWSQIVATTLQNGAIKTRPVGPFTGPSSFAAALDCK